MLIVLTAIGALVIGTGFAFLTGNMTKGKRI